MVFEGESLVALDELVQQHHDATLEELKSLSGLGETTVFGRGCPIPYSPEEYRDEVRKFIKSGWKTSKLSRYYQLPKKLYATTFMIPPVLSEIAFVTFQCLERLLPDIGNGI